MLRVLGGEGFLVLALRVGRIRARAVEFTHCGPGREMECPNPKGPPNSILKSSPYIGTLGPKYILFGYMDP